MSLVERKWGKKLHLVFKTRTGEIYLGPKARPRPDRVKRAIEYVDEVAGEYAGHYQALREKLLALLPEEEETS